jgi:galactoside O-acetyltransferase
MQRFVRHASAVVQRTAVFHGHSCTIGQNSRVDDYVLSTVSDVVIGRYVHIGSGVALHGGERVEIEDFVSVSSGSRIFTSSDTIEGGLIGPQIPAQYRAPVHSGPVVVKRFACVFAQSLVLPGVTIGEGAVVAAHSVVKRDLEPWTVYGGSPLRVLGTRERGRVLRAAELLNLRDAADLASKTLDTLK